MFCETCKKDQPVTLTQHSKKLNETFDILACMHWIKRITVPTVKPTTRKPYIPPTISYRFRRTVEQKSNWNGTIFKAFKHANIKLSNGRMVRHSRLHSISRIAKKIVEVRETIGSVDPWQITMKNGSILTPHPFQKEGVIFAETALAHNGGVLIADEMSLGKTVQALLVVRRNIQKFTPTLFVVPGNLTLNWASEFLNWVLDGDKDKIKADPTYAPIIVNNGFGLLPGFKFYFISQDVLRKKDVQEGIAKFGFQLLVVDECHKFKNTGSKRTVSLLECVETIPYKIMLSGTPIKNRFSEYFTALHLANPSHWGDRSDILRFAQFGSANQVLGIRDYKVQEFFELTSSYVIRRERKDVYKDLPPIVYDKRKIEVGTNKEFVGAYNKVLDQLDEELNNRQPGAHMYILALLQELRHITGLMKVAAATDFIEEFTLMNDGNQKLAVGCHHHDVEDYVCKIIKQCYNIDAIHSNGKDSPIVKMQKEQLFKHPEKRFAVFGQTAWGEGRNLQFCQNMLRVERLWSPFDEAQFDLRFSRPLKCACGSLLKKMETGIYVCPSCNYLHEQTNVFITVLNAAGTIDEFFEDLNEMKKAIGGQVMDKNWSIENDSNMILELARRAVQSRIKYVG